MKAKALTIAALAALALSACGGTTTGTSTSATPTSATPTSEAPTSEAPTPQSTEAALSPDWDKIPTGGDVLKTYVDESAAAKDCAALQDTFDIWADFTTPDGMHLTDVMTYIDDAMKDAGCY